jgi:hypothetical protein
VSVDKAEPVKDSFSCFLCDALSFIFVTQTCPCSAQLSSVYSVSVRLNYTPDTKLHMDSFVPVP